MKGKKMERRNAAAQAPAWVRASISFPPDIYESLEKIAREKKVSLAWVVRDATEKYVADRISKTDGRGNAT